MIRSVLICPGNREDLLAKLPETNADAFAIDLEGVPEQEKEKTREHLPEILATLRDQCPETKCYVRINDAGSRYALGDLNVALNAPIHGIILPRLCADEELVSVRAFILQALERRPFMHVIAIIESAAGLALLEKLLEEWRCLTGLAFGAENFMADMGGRYRADSQQTLYARSRIVLAARAAGLAALDHDYKDVYNAAGFAEDTRLGRDLGYTGKLCLTSSQVELVNQEFSQTEG